MQSQECRKCAEGTYSLGTGVAFDEWDSLPHGFVMLHHKTNEYDNRIHCVKYVGEILKVYEREASQLKQEYLLSKV